MVAENQPRQCTVCGVRVVNAGTVVLHMEDGRTSLVRDEPKPHNATVAPVGGGRMTG